MREIDAFDAKTHLFRIQPQMEISAAISSIATLRKKIAKRAVKITLKKIQKMKEAGRK